MSHAQSEVGIQLALRNGVDTIEHAIYLDAETIDLLLEKDAVVVPTFAIVNAIVHFGRAVGVPEYAMKKAEESHKAHLESIRRAFGAGVKIAAGTDFAGPVGVAHGDNAVELVPARGRIGPMSLRTSAIRRAVENLVSNALRYGTIARVSILKGGKSLTISVEDDGLGIPEDQHDEAMRPFSRLDPARNQDRGSGVGLGLAIVADAARAHGGTLRLGRSDELGGLRADIVLPL